jgi:hypothetical protein
MDMLDAESIGLQAEQLFESWPDHAILRGREVTELQSASFVNHNPPVRFGWLLPFLFDLNQGYVKDNSSLVCLHCSLVLSCIQHILLLGLLAMVQASHGPNVPLVMVMPSSLEIFLVSSSLLCPNLTCAWVMFILP